MCLPYAGFFCNGFSLRHFNILYIVSSVYYLVHYIISTVRCNLHQPCIALNLTLSPGYLIFVSVDIETVPQDKEFKTLDQDFKGLWEHKSKYFREQKGMSLDESYERAGIDAEFGKIICISVGLFSLAEGTRQFRVKSFSGHNEKEILKEFAELLNTHYNSADQNLCAHNGKEFDFPYIARRMLINGIKLPYHLDLAGKKPWEVQHLDTMALWKFGDYKHFTSIKLMTKIFGIPTPKDDIEGSDVARVYYEDKDLPRIVKYCVKDVVAVAQIVLKFMGEPFMNEEEVYEV